MADKKISDFTQATTVGATDWFEIETNGGNSRKIAAGKILTMLLAEQTASASSSLDFTSFISSSYDQYVFEIVDVVLATDNVDLLFRMSTDGGATYASGASDYAYGLTQTGGTNFHSAISSNSTSSIVLANTVDNGATNSTNGTLRLFAPSQTSRHKNVNFQISTVKNDNNFYNDIGAGRYKSTSAVNAVRFIASSGNITSGSIRVYGVAKP